MKALVVDDSDVVRAHYREYLKPLGFTEIVESTDGFEAMSALKDFEPDVVFLDWNMPNMTGLQFLKKVRPTHPDLPIIMVTAQGGERLVMNAIKAGVTDYVLKPFNATVLADRLKNMRERQQRCLLYTSPSPRDQRGSRMPSSA